MRRLAARALLSGGRITRPGVVYWDASAGCDQPFSFTLEGRSPVQVGRDKWGDVRRASGMNENLRPTPGKIYGADAVLWIDIDAPCRRCPSCLRRRAVNWTMRAKSELAAAPRTWFGTLTASPDAHLRMEYRAYSRLNARGVDLWTLPESEQFKERAGEMGKEVTLWLKRVRKESAAPLRYCLVAEAHKTGLPHYHVLMHECSDTRPVRHAVLSGQWALGHSRFTLVNGDPRAAWYVCKYLSKAALARVRASQHYGKTTH